MSIKDQLMVDLKDAMKNKNAVKKATITMLRAAVKQIEVDTREALSDDQIVEIIAKQIKQKRSAIDEFKKGDRQDLVDEAKSEIAILEDYLPAQLTNDEVVAIIKNAVEKLGATSMKDMGKVMAAVKQELSGRADNKFVADTVKQILG